MKMYLVFDTGEIWTEKEIKEAYEQFKDEMKYDSFEDYMDEMLRMGKNREGGLIEIEEGRI